jgi:serine/threonine protein kinase
LTLTDDRTITTRRHSYAAVTPLARGDLADVYSATCDGARSAVIKLPRDPSDSDLLDREATALRQLPKDGDRRFLPYVPELIESFTHRERATGGRRTANAVRHLDGFHSLAAVGAVHPHGLHPRDVAWIWRRLLVALGFAHRAVVLHGAVLPEHVLVHPAEHGLVLVDWCYSVPGCYASADPSGRVPMMLERYADWYPPEVPARERAGPAADIFMASRLMLDLMGDRAPRAMRAFAKGCMLASPRRRPTDAWRLLQEFDELLERLYGPRRFHTFTMPGQGPGR